MTAIATQIRITPEEFERMPDAKDYELVDGELVERHLSTESSRVGMRVMGLLFTECERTREAIPYMSEMGYQCYPNDPGKIRRPDGSIVRCDRLAKFPGDHGYMPIPADLVVEVISPNDLAYVVAAKVREYLSAGFPLIWVITPNVRTVTIYRRGRQPILLEETDEITAEPALAAFRCNVSAFFE